MRVDILDVATIDEPDEEGVAHADGVELDVDVYLDETFELLVGVGSEVDAGDSTEGGFVVGVDGCHLEPVLE